MDRRSFLLPTLAAPVVAGAEVWAVVQRSKIVDLTYRTPADKIETVRGDIRGIWFGVSPQQFHSTLYYLEVRTVDDRRVDIALDDLQSVNYVV